MKTKTLIKNNIKKQSKNLIKSHKELIIQSNFRNNQNYVLTDFWKYNFYNKYYNKRKIANMFFSIFAIIFWILFVLLIFLKETYFPLINFDYYLPRIILPTIFILVFWFIFYWIYYFIKWKILYHTDNKFNTNIYIFRKRIRNTLKEFNKYDFISFKK